MNNKIGVVSSTYIHYDIEKALDGISNCGFKYVELIVTPDSKTDIPVAVELKKVEKALNLCRKYNLELFCFAAHGNMMKDNSVSIYKNYLDAANLLGIKYINTDTGEVKNKSDEDKFFRDIKIIGDYAVEKQINVSLEIHGLWYKNGKIATEIVKKINHPNIKIAYDTGNTIYFGDTRPEEDINYVLPFLGYMHLKDKSGGYKVWDFPAIGKGSIDFNKIFSLLKDYSGPITVEIEFDGEKHPLDEINAALKQSYDYLKNYGF